MTHALPTQAFIPKTTAERQVMNIQKNRKEKKCLILWNTDVLKDLQFWLKYKFLVLRDFPFWPYYQNTVSPFWEGCVSKGLYVRRGTFD